MIEQIFGLSLSKMSKGTSSLAQCPARCGEINVQEAESSWILTVDNFSKATPARKAYRMDQMAVTSVFRVTKKVLLVEAQI